MKLPHHSLVRPVMALAFLLSCVSASTCPLNFSYVRRIHWNSSLCHNLTPSRNSTARDQYCCRDVLAVFGIALAQRLKDTSLFLLPNLPTSIACLQDFQLNLTSLSLPTDVVSRCLDPAQVVITNMCPQMQTTQDWVAKLGGPGANSPCRPDLTDLSACDACVNAGLQAQAELLRVDGNKTRAPDCFHFITIYAAGIVNRFGPESDGALSCIFGLPLRTQTGSSRYPGSVHERRDIRKIVIAAVPLGITIIAVSSLFLWKWKAKHGGIRKRIKRMLFINEPRNQSSFWSCNGDGEKMDQLRLEELPLFRIHDLAIATNSFHLENKLGEGGFGPVYKGILQDGQKIAVKRLSIASRQGLDEFLNEVLVISKLQHRNLVRLLGCCVEKGEKLLIYEYMPNNSLDSYLFGPKKQQLIDWKTRFKIIDGISRGLLYLHRDSRLKIIHRDLKASNILLDEELNPKISDFGMARIFGGNEDHAKTRRVVGTYGYMPPEYALAGEFSEKSDVFSFGVLLLEIITGKRSTGFYNYEESMTLLGFVWKLWNEENFSALMDKLISDPCYHSEVLRCIHVGLLCVQEQAKERPLMSTVCSMLSSEIMDLPSPKQPAFTQRPVATETATTSLDHRKKCSVNNLTVTIVEGR